MSGHVVFRDIFTLNAVSVIKGDFSYSSDNISDSFLIVTRQLLANQVYFYST